MSTPPPAPIDPIVVAVTTRPRSRWYLTLPLMIAVGTLAVFALQQPPDGKSHGIDPYRFIGRFHPMLVHMPIGLLILMPILDVLGVFRRSRHLWATGQLVMWLATLGTIVAATAGYLLARFDGHAGEDVIDHQWAGIATAGACCVALMFRSLARGGVRRKSWSLLYLISLSFTLVCLTAAGHLGGKLTHGDTYLTEYAPEPVRKLLEDDDDHPVVPKSDPIRNSSDPISIPVSPPTSQPTLQPTSPTTLPSVEPFVDASQKTVFASVIQPIFTLHCVECHGEKKVKGSLRLDSFAAAMEGGESGSTIVPNSVADSELARLIKLPTTDDDVMPPSKSPRMSADEIEAISWWIANGASDTLKIEQATDLPANVRALVK